ncbi:hypothetical protein FOA52_003584 [Chlamydomonas sp. UWO 241]|nr:hypothetical protein FOA52_003584 [Chlamydomonas sp. UWO 241]
MHVRPLRAAAIPRRVDGAHACTAKIIGFRQTGVTVQRSIIARAASTTSTGSAAEELGIYDVGVAMVQGLRDAMEDYTHVEYDTKTGCLFVGVYDGHGGPPAADWLSSNLHGLMSARVAGAGGRKADAAAMEVAMAATFADADAKVMSDAGSTGTVVLIAPGVLSSANVGDSSAVLLRKNQALDLTTPHRVYGPGPVVKTEVARVKATGAWVYAGRVCNILAVSRAFGDWEMKGKGLATLLQAGVEREYWEKDFADKQSFTSDPVIVDPAFSSTPLRDDDEVLVVATDGLWDVMPMNEVMRFAKNKLKTGQTAQQTAEALCAAALQRKSTDNVSVVVLDFKGKEHWEEQAPEGGAGFMGMFGNR